MPIRSRYSTPVPLVSVPTHLFGSPDGDLPDRHAFVDCEAPETLRLTLHDYREWSKRLAAGLLQAGLQDGDRVLLHSGNSIFTPVVLMGVIMAGGIISMANPMYVPRELAHQLRDSGAQFLLTATNLADCAKRAASLSGLAQEQIYLFDETPLIDPSAGADTSQRHWSQLIADPVTGAQFRWEEFSTAEQANRTACLFYSSGTTGVPKGVEATHRNLVANNCQHVYMNNLDPRFRQMDQAGESRTICPLPMFHGLGLIVNSLIAPLRRMPVYVMRRYDGKKMIQYIERFKVTEMILVPPIVRWMAKDPLVRSGRFDISSVRRVMCGAAPLSASVSKEFESLWKNKGTHVSVKQAWGMSEFPVIGLCWDDREASAGASVGEVVANCEAMLVDTETEVEITERGERGELWVRGLNVMKGYWRNPQATQATISPDGWVKTGDIAYVDDQNKFFIVDRKKELIKVKGNQVAPAELEAVLMTHSGIADAAVIGAKIGEDEQPRAYIVQSPGSKLTENDVVDFMAKNVAKIKRITAGVVFVDQIPRNPGKYFVEN
ncbi:hypothetical protein H2204_000927 [Knufia peltigerae]|uniref:4-coumarate--CoA ligase n=1 Tax=Knufia peltigerae TaxID=1002370 RepID=A0AA38YED8_9EURO|nr:hypothetical protein H2204_000927 [Knufia peltigerae]